jgi:hypothetical protein
VTNALIEWGKLDNECPVCRGRNQHFERVENGKGEGIYGVLIQCECGWCYSPMRYTSNGARKAWNGSAK